MNKSVCCNLYVFRTLFWIYVLKSHGNTGKGNKFLDKQKNLPACPVDKFIYFLNSNAVYKCPYNKSLELIFVNLGQVIRSSFPLISVNISITILLIYGIISSLDNVSDQSGASLVSAALYNSKAN